MKFYLYDTVRTKANLKEGEIFGNLTYQPDMKAEGAISCVDATDKTYRIFGSEYWYSEDMLEAFQYQKEPLTNADRIRSMTNEVINW